MLFNSPYFIFIFFPIITFGYFILPHRWRWLWLLLASCFFYMFFIPKYILILALAIVIDYFSGLAMEKSKTKKRKKIFLIISIVSNLSLLFFFKYFNFFTSNIDYLASILGWNYSLNALKIILPIGLSFHTFQSLSYIIEVYRGRYPAEHHFGIFALYVMFYPQLVAGPIERPQNLLPQFHSRLDFDYAKFISGFQLALWGLFKKVVIADRVSVFVNQIYNNVPGYQGPHFLLATFFFAIQIYCDFSGYSDIARGIARMMGFELMRNFRAPYFSRSISEFWQRWHISLSSWFRDYVYIPLGGNRVTKSRNYFNLFITFLLSGLWHGAGWTYVFWGSLNGLYLIIEKFFQTKIKLTINRFGAIIFNFFLICLAWIFFRASSFEQAIYILKQILSNGYKLLSLNTYFSNNAVQLSISGLMILLLIIFDWLAFEGGAVKLKLNLKFWKPLFFIFIFLLILFFGKFINNQFIYFQF
jgi:D-alanyl-lipoteichoic acid acyltransferase DltB (MBOAT superfamily)